MADGIICAAIMGTTHNAISSVTLTSTAHYITVAATNLVTSGPAGTSTYTKQFYDPNIHYEFNYTIYYNGSTSMGNYWSTSPLPTFPDNETDYRITWTGSGFSCSKDVTTGNITAPTMSVTRTSTEITATISHGVTSYFGIYVDVSTVINFSSLLVNNYLVGTIARGSIGTTVYVYPTGGSLGTLYIRARAHSAYPEYSTYVTKTVDAWVLTASTGVNGTVSPLGETIVLTGDSQTFAITPNTGYVVKDVLVDGISVGAVTSYTLNNISANHTISATFKAGQRYWVGVTPDTTTSAGTTINVNNPQNWSYSPGGPGGYSVPDSSQGDVVNVSINCNCASLILTAPLYVTSIIFTGVGSIKGFYPIIGQITLGDDIDTTQWLNSTSKYGQGIRYAI